MDRWKLERALFWAERGLKWAQSRLSDGTDYARKRYAAALDTYRLASGDAEAALSNPSRDDEPTWPNPDPSPTSSIEGCPSEPA